MDALPDDLDPITLIERAVSELRRSGGRPRFGPGAPGTGQNDTGQNGTGQNGGDRGSDRGGVHSGRRGPFGWKGGWQEHPFASMARYRLMSALDRLGDGASVSELADAIGVDQPRASRLVADAVERGLVTRTADPDDARRSRIALADAGREVLAERRRERRAAVERALDDFSDSDREQLAHLLARFVAGGRPS